MKTRVHCGREAFLMLLFLAGLGLRAAAPAALALLCFSAKSLGQGTMTIGFEGPIFPGGVQPQPRGTRSATDVYTESGMRFLDPSGPQGVVLSGGGISWAPENGTAYLQIVSGGVAFSFTSGAHFDLLSLDAAGYSTSLPGPLSLELIGYGDMGLRVTNYVAVGSFLDRRASQLPDFQTFYPGSRFVDLYRVDILADGWSMDNVVLGGVPEPSAGAVALVGAAYAFWFRRLRWRHCA